MAIKLKDSSGNVSLTTPVIKPATDLSNYYTKSQTDTAIDAAIQEIDLTPYATKTELEQYDTSYEVDAKIAAIEVDLTGYATESWVTEQIGGIEIPETDLTGYAKEEWVTGKLVDYTLKSELPNMSDYATKEEIPSLENYTTKDYVSNALTPYATKEELPDLESYALKTEIPDVSAYQTETQVLTLINTQLGVIENGSY